MYGNRWTSTCFRLRCPAKTSPDKTGSFSADRGTHCACPCLHHRWRASLRPFAISGALVGAMRHPRAPIAAHAAPSLNLPLAALGLVSVWGTPISSLPINRLRQLSTPALAYAPLHLPLAARSNATNPNTEVKLMYADDTWRASCCGARHLRRRRCGFPICRPRPLAQVALPAPGGAPIAPPGR